MPTVRFCVVNFVIHTCFVVRDKDRPSNPSSRGQVALLREILAHNDHVCYHCTDISSV